MGAYLGSKMLFVNKFGSKELREMYLGNQLIYGFTNADYSVDEMVGEKAPAGDYPVIKGTGSVITVSTNKYNPGYGYTKYYCDHMNFYFFYSGVVEVFDRYGNEIITVNNGISFSFASGKWEVTRKVTIYGQEVLNKTTKETDINQNYLTYEIYYDTANRQWVVVNCGNQYRSAVKDWIPAYFRLRPQIWFLISTVSTQIFDGSINVTYMNRAKGMPNAKT